MPFQPFFTSITPYTSRRVASSRNWLVNQKKKEKKWWVSCDIWEKPCRLLGLCGTKVSIKILKIFDDINKYLYVIQPIHLLN